MGIKINKLTNANIYINNVNLIGRAEEVTLPDVAYKMVEHNGLGMLGSVEFFSGIEKMEASIKWGAIYEEVAELADPFKVQNFELLGNLQTWHTDGLLQETSYKVYMKASFKNFPAGMFKARENVDMSTKMNVFAINVEIGAVSVFEFNAMTNKLTVNGQDLTKNFTTNIGG